MVPSKPQTEADTGRKLDFGFPIFQHRRCRFWFGIRSFGNDMEFSKGGDNMHISLEILSYLIDINAYFM